MEMETYKEAIRLGGCIDNKSPHDQCTEACQCYKITFSVCYRFKIYEVTMCREWVRYMAGASRKQSGLHSSYRPTWGQIITDEVHKFFEGKIPWMKLSRPTSEKGKKLCGSYEYYPTAFREVMMMNKWGYIDHYVDIKTILGEFPEHIQSGYGLYLHQYRPGHKREDAFRRSLSHERNNYRAEQHNRDEWSKFQLALWRIYASRESKFPQSIMHDMDSCMKFAERLLKLKIEDHATNEQQIPASLPV
jgi:hypothetical protein